MTFVNILTAVANAVKPTDRFECLFALSDHELAARGLNRDGLTRAFVNGLVAS